MFEINWTELNLKLFISHQFITTNDIELCNMYVINEGFIVVLKTYSRTMDTDLNKLCILFLYFFIFFLDKL